MKKILTVFLLILTFQALKVSAIEYYGSSLNPFDINIKQDYIPQKPDDNGSNKGLSPGGIVGIAAGAGGPAGATTGAVIAAPLLLAGLCPNSPVSAAAPIRCFKNPQCFLQIAITRHFDAVDYNSAKAAMESSPPSFYPAKNDSVIRNSSFDINTVRIPKELVNYQNIKINITVASDPYKEVNALPELALGLYKNINISELKNKFETRQFLHNYMMKKYEIPLKITSKQYANGIQKLSGIIDLSKIKHTSLPLYIVTRYTHDGFHSNSKMILPKTLTYAYFVEFKK